MYDKEYEKWLNGVEYDELKEDLLAVKGNDKEIEYRFGKTLEFGTAGMRGILGAGTNMMNVYTVAKATQGLANYIKSLGSEAKERGVVISYDTRKNSELFALCSAGVLSENEINVYIYDDVRPVPMLSFGVRDRMATAGIMITASHNPKEYNGYKVYGPDGAQMSPEATDEVVGYINSCEDYFDVKFKKFDCVNGINDKYVHIIGRETDERYYAELLKLTLSDEAVKKVGKNIKLVYTPVHGSGYVPVTTVLKRLGINATVVKEQVCKDVDFSTVKLPNPEFKETLAMGIDLADKTGADVVFGTDPDCDRLGVAIRNDKGEFVALNGNQTGILLLDYVLRRLKEENALPKNAMVVKSFVSTALAKMIADDYGVEIFDVPVGFKFIGEKIHESEVDKKHTFVFGFEESCGYLRGTHARDKDAVVASMLFAEMVCYYNYIGIGVYERLMRIYAKYGYFKDVNVSKAFGGLHAMDEMNAVVESLRKKTANKIGDTDVVATRDYMSGTRTTEDGAIEMLENDNINCLLYELKGGGFVCVRPSGTEPKLKVYYSVKAKDFKDGETRLESIKTAFEKIVYGN